MSEVGRRVNSIIVKNLPADYNESQLEELFSKFGRILSSKVLPSNANFDGGCGFVNYAETDSCNQAVETMNNFTLNGFNLRVSHSLTRMNSNTLTNQSPRTFNGLRTNGESNLRSVSSLDDKRETASPSAQQRFSCFRPASERSPVSTTQSKPSSTHSSSNELDTFANNNKPLWNSHIEQQHSRSPVRNETTLNINEHELFVKNKSYSVYLSNLEVPNVIFAATLDDYVNATLLITQMNKDEQLAKVQANAYKSKLIVGQCCAALFNGDWYRARVLEIDENRTRVQYIDWGNDGWCDSILEIRPLPNEYYKYTGLCVKCILDGIPTEEKPSDEQTNAILEILVLDVKLEMTISRMDKGVPFVQLLLGERNLNAEIRALWPQVPVKVNQCLEVIPVDTNKPVLNRSDIHYVQLTTVDTESECFHVLLMRDCLATIMNVMKEWSASKQPLKAPPKANMLVCAKYDGDDLWYRAWIESVTETGYRVYFVDFGNQEMVSMDRLSECPDSLRSIPWQSVQIKLAHIQLTDDERYLLLRNFESDRLEMKILGQHEDIYSVELSHNGQSLTEHMIELRQKTIQSTAIVEEVPKESVATIQETPATVKTESLPAVFNGSQLSSIDTHSISAPAALIANESNQTQVLPSTITKSMNSLSTATEHVASNHIDPDSLANLMTEQRRQNRLLEQVIAAINTTNALLTQLVQQSSP